MNTILSFDFTYQLQKLKKFLPNAYELDLTSMEGVKGYCDQTSVDILRKIWQDLSFDGLHFLGSGNYHYLSLFFLEKISIPFSLVVFDHHTDMQPSMFGNLLSCGSWIRNALETIPELRELLIIGVGEESLLGTKKTSLTTENFSIISETKQIFQCQYNQNKRTIPITILKETSYKETPYYENWEELYKTYLHYPVFLSIDKDVLSKEVLETDWDQGIMSWRELENACKQLLYYSFPLGVDICGEEMESHDISQSLKINQQLIQLFNDFHKKTPLI